MSFTKHQESKSWRKEGVQTGFRDLEKGTIFSVNSFFFSCVRRILSKFEFKPAVGNQGRLDCGKFFV